MKRLVAALALLFITGAAAAQDFTPVQGHYWNPKEPGTGYTISVQNGVMVTAIYSYTVEGDPIWYLVECPIVGKARTCTGRLTHYTDGQSIGGSFVAPRVDGSAGTAKFTWITEAKLEVLLPQNRVVTIVPLEYARHPGAAALLGRWVFVAFNAAGVTRSTPVLNFTQINKDNDEVYAPAQGATCRVLLLGLFGCMILDSNQLPAATWSVRVYFNDARGASGNMLDGDVVVQGYRLNTQVNPALE
jgi:hypothetical protein